MEINWKTFVILGAIGLIWLYLTRPIWSFATMETHSIEYNLFRLIILGLSSVAFILSIMARAWNWRASIKID